MKKLLISFFLLLLISSSSYSKNTEPVNNLPYSVIRDQVDLTGNNIGTWIWNTGVFNRDLRTVSAPGFSWPRLSGKFAIYATGLCIGTYVNNALRLASVSYNGEYAPGYISGGAGITNNTFKLYRVRAGDNSSTNPDYANWGLMVPYGAPYVDVNNNGSFEISTDKPGIKNASTTVFVCLTDAFPENHASNEGFSGGTAPVLAEMHMTAWDYITPSLEDVQFFKMEVINKNDAPWTKTFFGVFCDPDLGESQDDYVGCDSTKNFGFCYNATPVDGSGTGTTYGENPPAVGFDLLKGAINRSVSPVLDINMSSFAYMTNPNSGGLSCEADPGSVPARAYNYLRGLKRDTTPYVNPLTMQITKYGYSGDPESANGWTEYSGKLDNCGGATTGTLIESTPGDRKFVMGSGAGNLTVMPGEKQTFVIAQMIARGSNNRNAVTKLKKLDDSVQVFYNNNLFVDVKNTSSVIPDKFSLYQNYPNPFNPATKIKFDINKSGFASLTIFDANGKEVRNLVNQTLNAGSYEYEFDAVALPSGIYFYQMKTSSFSETKKMILIK